MQTPFMRGFFILGFGFLLGLDRLVFAAATVEDKANRNRCSPKSFQILERRLFGIHIEFTWFKGEYAGFRKRDARNVSKEYKVAAFALE